MLDDLKPFSESLPEDKRAAFETAIGKATEGLVTKTKTDLEEARKKAVPQKYDLKFNDNSPLVADQERIATHMRERGLTQEEATKWLAHEQEIVDSVLTRHKAVDTENKTKWENEVKADKELGGDKLPVTMQNVKRVMDGFQKKFPNSKLGELMNEIPYGSHPEWVRLISWLGSGMKEDSTGGENGGGGAERKSTAEVLYGAKSAS